MGFSVPVFRTINLHCPRQHVKAYFCEVSIWSPWSCFLCYNHASWSTVAQPLSLRLQTTHDRRHVRQLIHCLVELDLTKWNAKWDWNPSTQSDLLVRLDKSHSTNLYPHVMVSVCRLLLNRQKTTGQIKLNICIVMGIAYIITGLNVVLFTYWNSSLFLRWRSLVLRHFTFRFMVWSL